MISENTLRTIVTKTIQGTLSHKKTPVLSETSSLLTIPSTSSTISSNIEQLTQLSVGLPDQEHYVNDGLHLQTDKSFLQQQVQLLTTAFTLKDCPGLAGEYIVLV